MAPHRKTAPRNRVLLTIVLTSVGIGTAQLASTSPARADDPPPALQISDVQVAEPWSGSTQATFTVSLDAPAPDAVTVRARTYDGTAVHGGWSPDYVAKDAVVTFAAGEQQKDFTVTVRGSGEDEPDEWFGVQLLEPVGASVSDDTGVAWIDDADRDGWFVCHALPTTDPRMPPSYINNPTECTPDERSAASVPIGTIGTVSVSTHRQAAQPTWVNSAPPAVGDGSLAEVSLGALTMSPIPGTTITAKAVDSSTDARCLSFGSVPTLAGRSRVVGAKIAGLDLPDVIAGYQKYDLPNGLGTVQLNRQTVYSWSEGIRTYTVVRQDALVVTVRYPVSVGGVPFGLGAGGTFTAGTTTAGYYGNPCVT